MISSNILSLEGLISSYHDPGLRALQSIATFSDQAFSFSFNSFVSLQILGQRQSGLQSYGQVIS